MQDYEDSDSDISIGGDEVTDFAMNSTMRRVCKKSCDFKTYLDANIGEECPCCNGGCGEDYSDGMDSVSLLRFLAGLLQIEIKHALTKECMQDILDWARSGLRRYDRKIVPPSVYLLRQVMDVPALDRFEYHKCPCGYIYEDVVSLKNRDMDMKCAKCERTRFKRKGSPKPGQNFHFFGVEESIRSLFQSERFRHARDRSIKSKRAGNALYRKETPWFGFVKEKEPTVEESTTSIWSIGIDGAQPFSKRAHSVTLIVMKCEDMDTKWPISDLQHEAVGHHSWSKRAKRFKPLPLLHREAI